MHCRSRFLLALAFAFSLATSTWGASVTAAPSGPFTVKAFGAKGDGVTLDTDAINSAIAAAAAAGGGVVTFTPGTYLSASIHLQSHVTLHLEAGAVLEAASEKVARFDAPEPNEWGDRLHYQDFGHSHWKNSLIWGIGLVDIGITGPGLIHGKGLDNGFDRFSDEANGHPHYHANPEGCGNKAIALRDCNGVTLRDFSLLHGGWFGILATGVNNLVIDNLKIDTNRDGMDIDACTNVRVTRCSVNSPWDDGICLKASYGLGSLRHCDNVTISDCYLAGSFDEGTLLDGTFKVSEPAYKSYGTGRIKLGTESNGDFKNIAITNCVFDRSRGIALESVDGSHIEDVVISNITMRHTTNSPLFIRLGARLRGPEGTTVGTIKRINVSNLVASASAWNLGIVISGLPGYPIEDLHLSDLRLQQQGGGTAALGERLPPEEPKSYPEPSMFGDIPSYGFFVRHVQGLTLHHVKLDYVAPEGRPAFVLDDVQDVALDHLQLKRGTENAPLFVLRHVSDFSLTASKGIPDTVRAGTVDAEKF